MNCYDCATLGQSRPAVASCVDCGAGVCVEHAVVAPRYLARLAVINRIVQVEPPARVMRCDTCATAQGAVAGSESIRRSRKDHGLERGRRELAKAPTG